MGGYCVSVHVASVPKCHCPFRFATILDSSLETLKRPFNCCYRHQPSARTHHSLSTSVKLSVEKSPRTTLYAGAGPIFAKNEFIWIDVSAILTTLILWGICFHSHRSHHNGIEHNGAIASVHFIEKDMLVPSFARERPCMCAITVRSIEAYIWNGPGTMAAIRQMRGYRKFNGITYAIKRENVYIF